MKKSLFSLLALGMFLVGCQQDDIIEPINKENYTRAFIKQFGLIDPNHTWGFGKSTSTGNMTKAPSRTYDVLTDGELDGSKMNTQGNKWKNPPMVKDWEEAAVMNYLQNETNLVTVETPNLTHSYFITHVGSADKDFTTLSGDVKTDIKLDQMVVAIAAPGSLEDIDDPTKWDHAKDFNSSKNKDNLGNTVCVGGGSFNFAYHSGYDDRWYDKYIVIPGSVIDYRLSNYYYLCFDFEAYKAADITTNYFVYYKLDDGPTQGMNTVQIPGIYGHEWGSINEAPESLIKEALLNKLGNPSYTSLEIVSYSAEAQRFSNGDKFIKGDDIYDDWVIRLCGNAVPKAYTDSIPSYPYDDDLTKRIFAEDLSIAAAFNIDNIQQSDWDFNDLVMDVKFTDGNTKIVLRALGGTLPIYIGDGKGHLTNELHSYFKVPSSVMVNTGDGPNLSPVDISSAVADFDFTPGDFNSVKIYIQNENGYEELSELTADVGMAPSKLCVPSYLASPMEHRIITEPYPNFKKYVNDELTNFWEHKNNINNY